MTMTTNYSANEITVLKDLEPVQLRPGMYTDTTRPNHLAQEVIDNSVDEALAGFATKIEVVLHKVRPYYKRAILYLSTSVRTKTDL